MDVCDLIRKNLYCCYRLELLVANLLSLYAEKIDGSDPKMREAKVILKAVAIESNKHAELVDLLAKFHGIYEETTGCEQIVGEPWIAVQKLLDDTASGVHIGLKEFVERQIWVEKAVGEESYHRLLIPLLSEGLREGCIDEYSADIIKALLNKMALDEEWHEKMINTVANMAA